MQPSQQHVAPCVKKGRVGIGHEWLENRGSVSGRVPGPSSLDCSVERTRGTGVIPRRRCAVIGPPFQSLHPKCKETVGKFCSPPPSLPVPSYHHFSKGIFYQDGALFYVYITIINVSFINLNC